MNDRTTSIFHIISSYYCFECHLDELHVIPSKVIHNWDLSKYKGRLSKLLPDVDTSLLVGKS